MTPRLALVPGEPGGIGPELCVRLAQQPREDCTLLAFGDAATTNLFYWVNRAHDLFYEAGFDEAAQRRLFF